MSSSRDLSPETAGGPSRLEGRLERLERRLARLEEEVGEATGAGAPSRQLHELRQRLHELAERQRRLGEDLAAILDRVDPGRGSDPGVPPAAPSAAAARAGPLRAVAKLALRAPAAALRRLRRGAFADPPDPLVVEIGPPADLQPGVAVVQLASEGLDDDPTSALARSTEPPREVVTWDPAGGSYIVRDAQGDELRRGTAASPESLVEAIESDYLASDGKALAGLGATALELARLTLAGESLDFLELPSRGSPDGERPRLVRRRLWRPGVSLDALARSGGERGGPLVGKVVGPDRAAREPRPTAGFVAVPPYLLTRRRGPRLASHRHRLRPLGKLEPASGGGPPSVALVAGAPLGCGRDRLAADLLRGPGAELRLSVFTPAPSDELGAERLRHLERISDAVYPLGDFLAPELVPQAVALLARRHRSAAYLDLGEVPEAVAAELASAGVQRLDPRAKGKTPAELVPCGVDPGALAAAATREVGDALGQRLEVPDGAVLVAMVSDLYPSQRPEDFLALAHRLADDERFFFLLVGRGPLAGTLDDLERYLAPRRWRRLSEAPLAEVLAAADVAVDVAEEQPLPYFALSALAVGLPVVACASGTAALLKAEGCGLAVPVGETGRLAEAVTRLADPDLRAELGERGRHLVERRFTLDVVNERYRELFAQAPDS